ncbi:MAG: hypothetical protein KGJ37_00620 [Verrucomicrobiota bacterium]|nr:hypothetical protein [Verrucomicrobiota bacterium]
MPCPYTENNFMSHWEYKVVTSGKGGFASPALMEKFLNDLGQEEWEIIEFRAQPDNPLAFSGLARRSTQRDWTLEDAAAAAARAETEKLRAEFEAKFKAVTSGAKAGGEEAEAGDSKSEPGDTFRRPRDTERDLDPTATDEEAEPFQVPEEEELPTFFDAIRPYMRRNQRGPGLSVSIEYLVKKFDMLENDLIQALKECGLTIPASENEPPSYVEYDGDLYWVNVNRQKQLFINTREKPRPVFRTVQAARVSADTASKTEGRDLSEKAEASQQSEVRSAKPEIAPEPLPAGPVLLEKIRPLMRRNRRGPGGSGSVSFLSRALKCSEADLMATFASLGLATPAAPGDKPTFVEVTDDVWWLNKDQRGGVWINGREKSEARGQMSEDSGRKAEDRRQKAGGETPELFPVEANKPDQKIENASPLAAVRLLLKKTKTGAVAGKVDRLAKELGKSSEDLLAALVGAGLKIPEKAREKPVFVEQAGEIFWLNKNTKSELWLNAKESKFAKSDAASAEDEGGRTKPKRGRKKE